jgi:hypothetical protein
VTFAPPTKGSIVEEPDLSPGGDPPDDDRNDEAEGTPVPDPTDGDTDADDVPDAD